ncbi:MAG: MaoC family dehydratase [Promethearchaeia archaeon]
MSKKPQLENVKYEDYEVGDSGAFTKTVTQADVTLLAGISGDFNPLHVNSEFAKTTQFGKNVVHGVFSSALISTVLGTKLFGGGVLYVSQTTNFRKPVYMGDTLTAVATVKEKFTKKDGKMKFIKCNTEVFNQDDDIVTDGEALMLIMD